MGLILGQDLAQVAGVHDEDPVEEFTANVADPARRPRKTDTDPGATPLTVSFGTRWQETGKVPGPVMVWTPQQTGAFLDFIANERLYPLFHLVALRGLRRAEVAGLPWSDTDPDAGTITIRETRPDGGLYIDDPKSDSGEGL